MNATIKIPLLIFAPWYLGVNLIYGAEVSMELTPLWVFVPLIVALYIKMLRGLCAFYVACGKLKEDVRACMWQPVEDKNLDYKEVWRKKSVRFSRVVDGEVPGLCGVNMAILLQNHQVPKEG